jgi:autotransporter translocation and assembly factor TamB
VLRARRGAGQLQAAVQAGQGEARADAHWGAQGVGGVLALNQLPLGLLTVAGGPAVIGTANGEVRLEGQLAQPLLNADIQLTEFAKSPPQENAPPVDVAIKAAYKPNHAEGTVTVARLFEKPAEAAFSLPLVFSLSPLFPLSLFSK